MTNLIRFRILKLVAIVLLYGVVGTTSGCVDGPAAQLARLSPWRRQEWAEDEKYASTPHARMAELQMIADRARNMDPAEKTRVSRDLDLRLAGEKNPRLRAKMIGVMGSLDTPIAAAAIGAALKDSEPEVRIEACGALRSQGGDSSIRRLAEVVGSDTNLDVRIAAVRALGDFRDPRAVQALGTALDDDDPAIQYRAVQSLRSASGRDFGNSIPDWKKFVRGEPTEGGAPTVADRVRQLF